MQRELFSQLINDISNRDNLTIEDYSDGGSDMGVEGAKALYNGISAMAGVSFPESFIDFIRLGGEFSLYWNYSGTIYGEFDLAPFENVLMGMDNTQLWNDKMSPEETNFYKSLQTIDIHGFSGDGQYAALVIEKGKIPDKVWFVNVDAKFEMNLDYNGYLKALQETRGLHGWQYFYLNDYDQLKSNDYDLNRAKPLMKNSILGLENLFPEVDRSHYQSIYEQLFC